MSSEPTSTIRIFLSDLDGTLLGNPESTRRFKAVWENLSPESRPLLVYNSGRLVDDLRRFTANGILPEADYYVGGVGTQIYDVRAGRFLHEFPSAGNVTVASVLAKREFGNGSG